MKSPKLGAQCRRLLTRALLILSLPLLMGQDCNEPLTKTSANPVALDCVLDGAQVFIPIDHTVTLDREVATPYTGMWAETTVVARIPAAVFCALANIPMTQVELQSSTLVTAFDGVLPDHPVLASFFALNLPIVAIDTAAACAGAYGPEIDVDYGTVPAAPWSNSAWTVDFMVTLAGMQFWLTNISPPTPPVIDLLDLCDPTDKSNPPNGTTNDPEDSPRIAADRDGDEIYEAAATAQDQIQFPANGFCVGYRCDDFNDCTIDTCDSWAKWCFYDNEPAGTPCSAGSCDGAGTCVWEAPCDLDPSQCTKTITVGCANNVTTDVSMLDFELTVTPGAPVIGNTIVPVSYDGVMMFPEPYLDGAQTALGGALSGDLIDAQATVHVRSGGTAADVTLTKPVLPGTCNIDQASCDLANDGPSVPGQRPNTDCVPVGAFNPCQHIVMFPTSADCTPGGVCDLLGKGPGTPQCDNNGFCVTGPLPIPLQDVNTTFTADASGVVLFGYDDQSTGATLNPDGTWNLPPAVFTSPTGPNGVKINSQGLSVSLECTMAVDSNGPHGPVPPVPNQSSPTPNSELLQFNINIP